MYRNYGPLPLTPGLSLPVTPGLPTSSLDLGLGLLFYCQIFYRSVVYNVIYAL